MRTISDFDLMLVGGGSEESDTDISRSTNITSTLERAIFYYQLASTAVSALYTAEQSNVANGTTANAVRAGTSYA